MCKLSNGENLCDQHLDGEAISVLQMPYYKFLHSIHMDNILINGTLRVSSLSYYRRLEGPQWIADRLEGSIEVKMTEGLVVTGNEISSFTPEGFPLLVKADTGGKIVLGN
jgi:hypothetical protein